MLEEGINKFVFGLGYFLQGAIIFFAQVGEFTGWEFYLVLLANIVVLLFTNFFLLKRRPMTIEMSTGVFGIIFFVLYVGGLINVRKDISLLFLFLVLVNYILLFILWLKDKSLARRRS